MSEHFKPGMALFCFVHLCSYYIISSSRICCCCCCCLCAARLSRCLPAQSDLNNIIDLYSLTATCNCIHMEKQHTIGRTCYQDKQSSSNLWPLLLLLESAFV